MDNVTTPDTPDNLIKAKQQLAELQDTLAALALDWIGKQAASEAIKDAQEYSAHALQCLADVY